MTTSKAMMVVMTIPVQEGQLITVGTPWGLKKVRCPGNLTTGSELYCHLVGECLYGYVNKKTCIKAATAAAKLVAGRGVEVLERRFG